MCPEGLDVELRGEDCLACKGLGSVPALKREEGTLGTPKLHKLSTHQESTPSDSLAPAWKHLSSGQVDAEVRKEQHPAEKGKRKRGKWPVQGHGCRSESNPSLRRRCFSR